MAAVMKVPDELMQLMRLRWSAVVGSVVVLLALLLIGYWAHREAEDTLRAEYATRMDDFAVERRQTLVLLVRQRQEALQALAQAGALPGFTAELAQADRADHPALPGTTQSISLPVARRFFDGILMADPRGTVRRAAGTLKASQANQWAEDLAMARQGPWARFQGGIGDPSFLLIGLMVTDGTGKEGEVVLVRSPLDDVERLLNRRGVLGAGGESFVVDRDGRVVTPPLRHAYIAGRPIVTEPMRRCLGGEARAFVIEPDYAGVLTAMAYQPLPELGSGCLMAHVPADDISVSSKALRDKTVMLVGIAGAVLVPLALAIGWVVGRKTKEALQQAREELERLVHERSAELEAANASLQTEIVVRRQAEDALQGSNWKLVRHTIELESVNKELERFCYSISHDLRAPLRSLDGFSLALLEDCAGQLSKQGMDYLNRIRAASQRMSQLIDDLLKLARLSRQDFLREPLDVSELAQSVSADLRHAWPNRQVDLTVAPGLMADADPRLFRVVLNNLLGNAWKFTSKQERVVIEVGAVSHEETTAYFVRDNGVGFEMAYADKLFGAFQRLHAMTEYPGTGIGLATVQRIITRHGGRVWAEGRVGQGATFYFTLGERSA